LRHSWLIGLALLSGGCGTSAYEERMLKAQQSLQRFEDESRSLDEPIVSPRRPNKEGQFYSIANVFLRPPRGIGPNAANEKEPRGGKLYTYAPRKENAARPFSFVEVAVGSADNKEFVNEVFKVLGLPASTALRPRTLSVPGRAPLNLESADYDAEATTYSIHLLRGGSVQVLVVYWVDKANRATAARTLNLSLETLGLNEEATRLREQFQKGSPLAKVPGRKEEG
jgi:hypothetical protein